MKRAQPEAVEIPGLDVAKAKRYSRTKLVVLLLSTLWSVVRLAWFASDRRAARLKASIARGVPDRRLAAPAFFALTMALSWLSSLPVAYVGGHQVERRFGLTKQSTGGWLGDQAKGLLLGLLLADATADGGLRGHPAATARLVADHRRRVGAAHRGAQQSGSGAVDAAVQPVPTAARRDAGRQSSGSGGAQRRANQRRLRDGHEPAERETERHVHRAGQHQANRARRYAAGGVFPRRGRGSGRSRAGASGPRRHLAIDRIRSGRGVRDGLAALPNRAACGTADPRANRGERGRR